MRIIVAALWVVLFVVLFAFAVNNTAPTDLHFFAGIATRAPLIALLLAFFIGGFVFGTLALLPGWVRQRVELRRLRRIVERPAASTGAPGAATDASARSPSPPTDADGIQSVARGAPRDELTGRRGWTSSSGGCSRSPVRSHSAGSSRASTCGRS